MKLYSVSGKLVYKNLTKYYINWDGRSRSKIQFAVKQFLKPYWKNSIVCEESPVFGTLLKVDFLNLTKKIAVEVDGDQHEAFNEHFHNKSRLNYLASIKRDWKKEEWLEKNNFILARIKENEIVDLSVRFFKDKFNINLV